MGQAQAIPVRPERLIGQRGDQLVTAGLNERLAGFNRLLQHCGKVDRRFL
ncbi:MULTISPECIES: hypothetical protein [Methylocaldum]|nr:hypothetical protein [Methylocaldum sp. 14B]